MIGFRVDANEIVATGHLMRCMSIATECRKLGETCIFLLADDKETDRLRECGFDYRVLHSQWNHLELEKEQVRKVIEQERLDWLVVDSYQVSDSYLRYLERFVKVLYIDDSGIDIYPVSAVLHYSQWEDDSVYQQKYRFTNTTLLAGMKYVPLREEFRKKASAFREKSILITTGGTDPFNIAGRLLQLLVKQENFLEISFEVIVGSMNQNTDMLEKLAECEPRIYLHKNIKNIDEYMRKCSCGVSAGGTTLFELCASGLPTVCFSFADNQIKFSRELAKRNVMMYAGDARGNDTLLTVICEDLKILLQDKALCQAYTERMQNLVDGNGAFRIAEFLTGSVTKGEHCVLRNAQEQDAKRLYEWKNDELCIWNSMSGCGVTWQEHQLWFKRILKSRTSRLFIMETNGIAAGQLRLDWDGDGAVISYSIAKEFRGQHLGKEILRLAERAAPILHIYKLKAVVLKHNVRSRNLFLKLGYHETEMIDAFYYEKMIDTK